MGERSDHEVIEMSHMTADRLTPTEQPLRRILCYPDGVFDCGTFGLCIAHLISMTEIVRYAHWQS